MSKPVALEDAAAVAVALGLSQSRVRQQLDLFQLRPTDRDRLRTAASAAPKEAVTAFIRRAHQQLSALPELAQVFERAGGPTMAEQIHQQYLSSTLEAPIDWTYVLERLRVGLALHRLQIGAHWYLALQGLFVSDQAERLIQRSDGPIDQRAEKLITVIKTVLFDASLTLDAYLLRKEQPSPASEIAAHPESESQGGTPTMTRLDLSHDEHSRRAVLRLDAESHDLLSTAHPVLTDCLPQILEEFDAFIADSTEASGALRGDVLSMLRSHTEQYWARLSVGAFDGLQVAFSLRVGVMLERFGLSLDFYLSSLARQLGVLVREVARRPGDVAQVIPVLLRAVMFDLTYAVGAYLEARAESLLHAQGYADQLVADLTTGVAVVDAAHRVEAANRAMLELVGIDAGLVHRIEFARLLPIDGLSEDLRRVLRAEAVRTTRRGSLRGREVSVSLVRLGAQPAGKSERRKVAALIEDLATVRKWVGPLERDSRSFESLVERVGATVWEADSRSWTLVLISRPVEELTGEPDVSWLGRARAWPDAIPEPDRSRFLDACNRLAVGKRVRLEHGLTHRDGRLRWAQTEVRRERLPNGAEVFSGVTIDITEKRDEHLRRLDAVSQLGAGVAHEFNNLLTIILTNLEALEAAESSEPRLEGVRAALSAAQRGASVTQRLLAFSRTQLLRPADVKLGEIVRSMAERIRRLVGPGINVTVLTPDDAWFVHLDPESFRQALLSLVDNGRAAMVGRGGRLTVTVRQRTRSSEHQAFPGQDVVELEVADTGEGMTEAVRARAFEPFFTTRQDASGWGLGLSVVHGFVMQSGGQIELESEPGEGTRVRISFRRASAPAETAPAPSRTELPTTVLVVDDEPLILRGLARLLQRRGFEVVVADSTASALRLLEGSRVELVLTDYHLGPGDNGLDLAREVRRVAPKLPIILSSGYLEQNLQSALPEGVAFLPKPFVERDLLSMIRTALQSARAS